MPVFWAAALVDYRDDHNFVAIKPVNYLLWKSAYRNRATSGIVLYSEERVRCQTINAVENSKYKLLTHSRLRVFVEGRSI